MIVLDYIKAAYKCLQAQIRWFKEGKKYTTPETALERLSKCVPCDFNKNGRCSLCKCPLNEKINMQSEFCPIDRWK
jgi:hypothetical protein